MSGTVPLDVNHILRRYLASSRARFFTFFGELGGGRQLSKLYSLSRPSNRLFDRVRWIRPRDGANRLEIQTKTTAVVRVPVKP
jgi:hypothetical protein